MEEVFGPFALVVDFLTAVCAEVLLAALAEHGLHLVGGFLALLAHELYFGFMGGVAGVACGAAELFAAEAPQRAFGLVIAFFAFYGHWGGGTAGIAWVILGVLFGIIWHTQLSNHIISTPMDISNTESNNIWGDERHKLNDIGCFI
jgi:hypothetical protein